VARGLPIGEFEEIRFPSISGTSMALVVKARGPIADTLEVWSLLPLEKKGTLSPAHRNGARSEYVLGPKGATVARVIDFPRQVIEIRNVADDKVLKTIELGSGSAEIVGFGLGNQIVVLRDGAAETYDTVNGARRRTILL